MGLAICHPPHFAPEHKSSKVKGTVNGVQEVPQHLSVGKYFCIDVLFFKDELKDKMQMRVTKNNAKKARRNIILKNQPGGGNGIPLQYSCLEIPKDRRAWQAAVHRLAQSQTGLSQTGL